MASERQHHRHGVLGSGNRIAGGRVDHQDAGARGCLDIDVVDACAGTSNHLESGAGADHPVVDSGFTADHQRLVVTDGIPQCVWTLLEPHVNLSMLAKTLDTGFSDRVGDQDPRHGAQATRLVCEERSSPLAAASAAPRSTWWPCISRPCSSASTVAITSAS